MTIQFFWIVGSDCPVVGSITNRRVAVNQSQIQSCLSQNPRLVKKNLRQTKILFAPSQGIIGSSAVQGESSAALRSRGNHRQLCGPGKSPTVSRKIPDSFQENPRQFPGKSPTVFRGNHRQLRSPGGITSASSSSHQPGYQAGKESTTLQHVQLERIALELNWTAIRVFYETVEPESLNFTRL